MAKYRVHFGVRLTLNVDVEAETREEAEEMAREVYDDADWHEFDFAEEDVDIWEQKD